MFDKLKNIIINYVFKISLQPVLFSELLLANKLFNSGMHLKGVHLGFRLRLGRAYFVFLIFSNIFILPILFFVHELFAVVDCHISILIAVVFTATLFIFMGIFKEWLYDEISIRRIKYAWKLHFPLFSYEKYNTKVVDIYIDSQRLDIEKKDLEKFTLDKLIKSK